MTETTDHHDEKRSTANDLPAPSSTSDRNTGAESGHGPGSDDVTTLLSPVYAEAGSPKQSAEIFRKTELHHIPPSPFVEMNRDTREKMLKRIRQSVGRILGLKYGASFDDIICLMAKKQDRLDRDFAEQVCAIMSQIDNLELEIERVHEKLDRRIEILETRAAPRGKQRGT